MNKNKLNPLFFALAFSSLLISCGTQNASFLKQGYHDLTSRYNANFNAKEKLNLTLKSLKESRKENYDELLPLFSYGTLEDTKTREADFDIVIDKASTAIQLHKISNWSDDNFLLLGKSFYFKGDYPKAIESLRYITANYKDGVDGRSDKKIKKQKNSKKLKAKAKRQDKRNLEKLKAGKDIRPKKSFLKHLPAKSEALVWLVKAFTANKQLNEAQAVLDYIALDNSFIQNYDREKELVHADYLIHQKLYSEAIPHIQLALESYKSNKKKARYKYVLAQLYQKTGNNAAAVTYYKDSEKGNSNYDMIFNAKLNALKLSSNNKDTDKEDKLLAKLIKDSKNIDYLDQLYYERAIIAKNKKDIKQASDFLALSIEKSTTNTKQKAKSYVMLAEIFYSKEDYTLAQENYAAALPLITPEFANYTVIAKRANVLTDLVNQLNIISKNDSLLKLANLSPERMERMLYDQAVASVEAQKKGNGPKAIVDKFAQNDKPQNDAKWYFYSENAKSIGYNTFKQKWGNRVLEDNWRRTNKASGNTTTEIVKTEEELTKEKIEALYQQLLAEIPKGDSGKIDLKNEIVKAHYTAGNIYKFDLNSEPKAIDNFMAIVSDYPKSEYDAESLYNLYILNKEKNNTAADKYKNLVLTNYPDSKYAKIIKDPLYAESLKSENIKVESFYEETYNLYAKDEFEAVINRINEAKTLYPNNKLEAKFALLEAITFGKQSKYQPYVDALEAVVKNFKNTEEEAKATEMLAFLKGKFPEPDKTTVPVKIETEKESTEDSLFDADKGKDKEGFKLNFGKKELLKVGVNEDAEKKAKEDIKKDESEDSELKKIK